EYPSVLLADAVRDDVVVERLLLPEHLRSSLVLAPRAHDGHGPASVAAVLCNHVRFATDPSQSGLSLHRRVEHPAGARPGEGACAGDAEALLMGGPHVTLPGRSRGPRKRMGRLDGKVVVVTGASRGIGAEIARVFAAEGGRVVCAARTLREGDHRLAGSLETTVASIRAAGGEARTFTANIAEPAECEKLIRAARAAYGPSAVL